MNIVPMSRHTKINYSIKPELSSAVQCKRLEIGTSYSYLNVVRCRGYMDNKCLSTASVKFEKRIYY